MSIKSLMTEFKDFALKGNVMDMAVGVVVGGAFSKIVTSLVDNIISPIIGMITGGIDFSGLSVTVGEAKLMYGSLITDIIDFIIIAACIFAVVKAINTAEKKFQRSEEEEAPAEPAPTTEELLSDIKGLLTEMKDK